MHFILRLGATYRWLIAYLTSHFSLRTPVVQYIVNWLICDRQYGSDSIECYAFVDILITENWCLGCEHCDDAENCTQAYRWSNRNLRVYAAWTLSSMGKTDSYQINHCQSWQAKNSLSACRCPVFEFMSTSAALASIDAQVQHSALLRMSYWHNIMIIYWQLVSRCVPSITAAVITADFLTIPSFQAWT